jgi:hypothetical protein
MLRDWVEPLWVEGTAASMSNVHTQVWVAIWGDVALPLSVGSQPGDAYVVSPTSHYIRYAVDECRPFGAIATGAAWLASLPLIALFTACRMDRVVLVNNWLLSTNLYPPLTEEAVMAFQAAIRERWPDHAVVWRSVDDALRSDLRAWLEALGGTPVFARRIHVVEDGEKAAKRSNNKKDRTLANQSPYRPSGSVEPERAARLYAQLYIDKYSSYNPRFTPAMIQRAERDGLLEITSWAKSGEPASAVIGTWTLSGVLTTPLLGYDTDRPAEDGLYRLACRGILDRALQRGVIANRSAGAARFKQLLGARSVLEHNLVFVGHLGAFRRLPWALVRLLLERWVVPMILKNNL